LSVVLLSLAQSHHEGSCCSKPSHIWFTRD
jgi:hypothetical protein